MYIITQKSLAPCLVPESYSINPGAVRVKRALYSARLSALRGAIAAVGATHMGLQASPVGLQDT